MPRKPVSLTLGESNLLWLRARARAGSGNVSETVDQLISRARQSLVGGLPAARSVVGTIDLPDDFDDTADAAVRELFATSLDRSAAQLKTIGGRSKPTRKPRRRG